MKESNQLDEASDYAILKGSVALPDVDQDYHIAADANSFLSDDDDLTQMTDVEPGTNRPNPAHRLHPFRPVWDRLSSGKKAAFWLGLSSGFILVLLLLGDLNEFLTFLVSECPPSAVQLVTDISAMISCILLIVMLCFVGCFPQRSEWPPIRFWIYLLLLALQIISTILAAIFVLFDWSPPCRLVSHIFPFSVILAAVFSLINLGPVWIFFRMDQELEISPSDSEQELHDLESVQ